MRNNIRQSIWQGWTDTSGTSLTTDASNSAVWVTWNGGTASSSTVTINVNPSSEAAWYSWQLDTGTGASTDPVWGDWATDPTHAPNFNRQILGQPLIPRQETSEEREARVQRELQQQQEWERRRAERHRQYMAEEASLKAARIEAKALLDSVLNDVQRKSLEEEDWFLVIGSSGNIYRLRKGRVGNIDLISPEGKLLRTICSHPGPRLPNADDLVAQKLYLETDENYVHERANVHRNYGDNGEVIDITKHLPRAA